MQHGLTLAIACLIMTKRELEAPLDRPIALLGLMGVGKSSIGRRLSDRLRIDFVDSDQAIETAAGKSIAEIFADEGEVGFREGERRVITRLINERDGAFILALGGGAFINDETRTLIKQRCVSVWLQADIDVLLERTSRKPGKRPLLDVEDPRSVLVRLASEREPYYQQADLTVRSEADSHDITVDAIIDALNARTAQG